MQPQPIVVPAIAPDMPTGSLAERAMLVTLNMSTWSGQKVDKGVTNEVARIHGNAADMGAYQKRLVSKDSPLTKLKKIQGQARLDHYARTLPWADNGLRILSNHGYFGYMEAMSKYRTEFDDVLNGEFLPQYQSIKDAAKLALNGLYDESDYPSHSRISQRFEFRVKVLPFPTADDFRVSLGDAEINRVRCQIQEQTTAVIQAAMADVWGRVSDAISKLANKLKAYQPGSEYERAQGTFHDSLVGNIIELLDLLPGLNITQDPNLSAVAARAKVELTAYTADQLRDSDQVRMQVADAAGAILKSMEDFI